jgi:acyl dehydratase
MNGSGEPGENSVSSRFDPLEALPVNARKLLSVIVQQAGSGPMRPKRQGTCTPPEILEACGLDVAEFYELLNLLAAAGLVRVRNAYPFEEIEFTPQVAACQYQAAQSIRYGMILREFDVPADQRFFEDYVPGRVYEFGAITMTETDIVEFAARFDPQSFHLDPITAAASQFGGIIASGWHTIGVAMRLLVDHYLTHVASLGSPGVDEIRWPNPVRPGDTLRIRATIIEARTSRSKPDRGIIRTRVEALNQKDELVLSMIAVSFLGRRPRAEAGVEP